MELRTTREMRRNVQIDQIMGRKSEAADTPAGVQTPRQKEPADKLTLSRQAVAFVEEQNRKMWNAAQEREQRRQNRMNKSISAMESAKGELDLLSNGLRVLELCRKIAASIMKGNRVPPEDLEFLMKNDPDGYRLAMAMRRHNPDPEDEKSVLTDEDKNGGRSQGASGGGEAPSGASPSVQSAASAESGGDTSATVK